MIPEIALAMLSLMVIAIGVGSCIMNVILSLKMSGLVERNEKLQDLIIKVMRDNRRRRK